jgi:hypothetical protein
MKLFWAGWLAHMGLTSLHQDYYGKAHYIELVQDKWIDPSITIPLALALLVIAFYLCRDEIFS